MTMHRLRLSGFCLALALAAWPALAQAQPVVDKLITVTGEATVSVTPDLAMVAPAASPRRARPRRRPARSTPRRCWR